jgi:polysaccharide biosynthesis/export protein
VRLLSVLMGSSIELNCVRRLGLSGPLLNQRGEFLLMTQPATVRRIAKVVTLLVLLSARALAQSDSGAQPVSPATAAADKQTNDKSASDKPADAKPAAHSDSAYVIGANDVLAINVWKEPDISRSVPVRSDGKISLPLVGELQAGGQTPRQLEQEITKRLQSYISEPEVTVIVTDSKSQKVNILGMVARPGAYLLTSSTTVLDAIAMAGGFKDFAKQKAVYVLRQAADGTQQRMPFNYKDVIKGKNPEQNVRLQAGDTVVIP